DRNARVCVEPIVCSMTRRTTHINSRMFKIGANIRRLHSFPTRRSSDLLVKSQGPRGFPPGPRRRPNAAEKVSTAVGRSLGPGGKDRKSTRLNSSHVAISYAVVCLKKKNTVGRRAVRNSAVPLDAVADDR